MAKLTPFEAWKLYMAIKLHFTSSDYDFFKYGGKSSGTRETFNKRNDVYVFAKLARHEDPLGLLVSNFAADPTKWHREVAYSQEAEGVYKSWLKKQQSLTYTIKSDLSKLDEDFDKNFVVENGKHPLLLRLYMQEEIQLETLCILAELTECINYWQRSMQNDLIWNELKLLIIKYTRFIGYGNYDKDKIKQIVVDYFAK